MKTLPAWTMLALFLAGPLALLVRVSLCESGQGRGFYVPATWTLAAYCDIFTDPVTRGILLFSVLAGLGITVMTLMIAYSLALFIHGLDDQPRRYVLSLVVFPKLCNVLALIYGLQLLLPRGLIGVVLTEVYLLLPYAILLIVAGMGRIEKSLIDAARGLGASRRQTFMRVTLPLSWPGLLAATQLTLLWAMAAVLGPIFFGGPESTTLAVELQRQATEYNRWPRAAALAVLLMIVLTPILWMGSRETN
ncbi:MAG: ABC transporter permease subunit [Planctomycetia bacterium]|nr:ABC transporter permease subunit [Planctomycetia bacterium]